MSELENERAASILAAATTLGMRDLQAAFKDIYCGVVGESNEESALLSLMATTTRLMALEIVLMRSAASALGVPPKNVSELMFDVRRGTVIAHIISKALFIDDAKKMFPELRLEEAIDSNWEKEVSANSLAKALKTISQKTYGCFNKKRHKDE